MRWISNTACIALLLGYAGGYAGGCAAPMTRFIDQPIVWNERDDHPIPLPKKEPISVHWSAMRDIIFLPLDRALALDYGEEAGNANAVDEVAESSWFQDPRRNPSATDWRPRPLTTEEMFNGPSRPDDEPVLPLTVTKGKAAGSTPGFVARDARGVQYLIKMDGPGPVGLSTSTELIASRLVWAAGWRVPSLVLIDVAPTQIEWAPGVLTHDRFNRDIPYTREMHERLIAKTPRDKGKIRILASRWLDGKVIGSFLFSGRRSDDPNDLIDHEDRRDLRGFGVVAAWINNVDTPQNNTLELYVGAPGQGHVQHYQQDVGGAFGTWAALPMQYWMGHEGYVDPMRMMKSLALGIPAHPWEGDPFRRSWATRVRTWPELGGFDYEHFEPRKWRPAVANPAFDRQTARDRYWGAKRVIAFNASEIRAAISAGRYPKLIADRLFEVLWERRRRIAAAYLTQVASLDYFRFDEARLCFVDLYYQAGLQGPSTYRAREHGRHGTIPVKWRGTTACISPEPNNGHRVFELDVRRGKGRANTVRVHAIDDHAGRRIIGLERGLER